MQILIIVEAVGLVVLIFLLLAEKRVNCEINQSLEASIKNEAAHFNGAIDEFKHFYDIKKYDRDVSSLAKFMEEIFKHHSDKITSLLDTHTYNNNDAKELIVLIQRQLTSLAQAFIGKTEDIFLKSELVLTEREKEIVEDFIKVRSIYLTEKEKQELHNKLK